MCQVIPYVIVMPDSGEGRTPRSVGARARCPVRADAPCHSGATRGYSAVCGACRHLSGVRAWSGRSSSDRRAEGAARGHRWERRVAGRTRRGRSAVPRVEQRLAPAGVIIGDEHTAVTAVAGELPDRLRGAQLLIPPAAHKRLRVCGERMADASGSQRGQISGPLMELAPDVRAAVLDADTRVFAVVPEESLRVLAENARGEAAAVGVHLNLLASEYVAAAIAYRAVIWFGHDRNVPPPIRDDLVPQPVRWGLLSELRPD